MCGLVGVFGAPSVKLEGVFKDLLQFDVVRGPHSTGVALTNMDRHVILHKSAVLPQELMGQDIFKGGMQRRNSLLMGHNRLATVGKVNDDNAHPFHFEGDMGKLVGAHNGTLRNKWELENGTKFDTDSQAMFNHMATKGLKETWKTINGAAAVSIYEVNHHHLTLATNGERPLHYTILGDKRQVIWASEAWMIRAACWRRGVKIGKVIEIENNKGVLFWMKGENIKHQMFKLIPRPKPKPHYFGGGKYMDEIRWIEWCKDRNEWVEKVRVKGVTSTIPLGKDLGRTEYSRAKNRQNTLIQLEDKRNEELLNGLMHRDDIDKSKLQDGWTYYLSSAYTEESFHANCTNCRFCDASLLDEYGHAVVTDEKNGEAVCSECYVQCANADFDPGANWK